MSGSSTARKMGSVTEGIFVTGVNGKKTLDAIGHKGKKRETTSLKEFGIDRQGFRDWLVDAVENVYKQQG